MTKRRSYLADLTYYRGRVGLRALLNALHVEPGDNVLLQAFTCVAVPEGIMAAGAHPVWIDIEADGFNMDAVDLKYKLTPRTRAIIVQHTYGIPADIGSILPVANELDLPVIEDCCHTLASTYQGKTIGSFGVASFYSFEWGKPIVAGIGGSAAVSDRGLRQQMHEEYANYRIPGLTRLARIQLQYYAFGLLYRPRFYWPVRSLFHRLGALGMAESNYNSVDEGNIAGDFNLRMAPALQRRLQRKLTKLGAHTAHSRWVVNEYRARIQSAAVTHPTPPKDSDTVFARYPLLAKDKAGLLAAARKANVELSEWYTTPVHPLTGEELSLVHYEPGSCPNAENRCSQVVALPTHPAVSERDVDRAIEFLNAVSCQ